jgi:hypothetical protein
MRRLGLDAGRVPPMRIAMIAILLACCTVSARADEKQAGTRPVCLNCDDKAAVVEKDREKPPEGELTLPPPPAARTGMDVPVTIPLGTNDVSLQNMTNMQVLTK